MIFRHLPWFIASVAALGSMACTDSAGPKAAGAVRIQPLGGCGAGPYLIPLNAQTPLTDTNGAYASRATNGGGVKVQCSVAKSGDGYQLHIEMEDSNAFNMNGAVQPTGDKQAGSGSVGFWAGGYAVSAQDCSIEVPPTQEIAKGRVWGNVVCENGVQEGAAGSSPCRFRADVLAENCSD